MPKKNRTYTLDENVIELIEEMAHLDKVKLSELITKVVIDQASIWYLQRSVKKILKKIVR